MSFARNVFGIYARIGRTYRAWARSLLVLALVVFIPLGLLDALTAEVNLDSLDITSGLKLLALMGAIGAITTTSLLGEVFFSGAVAVSLTHPEHLNPPSLTTIARHLRYGRLIGVDILYVLIVGVGLALFIVPGVLAFVWLGLSGPAVELEHHTVRGALVRSWRLVRGNFWTVFFVLVPIEIVGDGVGEGIAALVHAVLGHSVLAGWMAESASNVVFSPIFAVAAVLLTLELIEGKDGTAPPLHSEPAPA